MKALVSRKYGSPEVLKIEDVNKPVLSENDVLVKVKAFTVNRTDCAAVRAKPYFSRLFLGLTKPKKNIRGTDFSGTVEAVGNNVYDFKAGDRVFGFEDEGLGSQAEYLVLSQDKSIAKIPDVFSFEEAVTACEGFHYAINFVNKVQIKSGQKILVNGATGAIGSALMQILKEYEVEIVAVCNTKNIELVKSIGAHKTIDYSKEDFTLLSMKFDYIFDAVGKSSFGKCKALLKDEGIYISSELGAGAQNIFYAILTPLFGKKKVVFPMPIDCRKSLLIAKDLITDGKFKPIIDRSYKFEDIIDAYKYVESGQKTGNVIVIFD